jgi:hypothetical protein
MMETMTRVTAVVISVVAMLIAIAGCAVRGPGATGAVPGGGGAAATAKPSVYFSAQAIQAGGSNPQAAIPNPGTGTGDRRLAVALLPHSASGRAAALLLPPAVVALPDRDPSSTFIGLRQYSSPVNGPKACDGWTAGLWVLAVTSFNRPGVQLAVTEQSVPTPAGLPSFSEAIITGPPSVLGAMDSPLPPDCRTIGGQPYPGGVRVVSAPPGPGSRHARAFEVTGTGKVPVWQWAEVVRGPDFLLEIRIPDQSAVADPFAALATITGSAYGRAAAVLSLVPSGRVTEHGPCYRRGRADLLAFRFRVSRVSGRA